MRCLWGYLLIFVKSLQLWYLHPSQISQLLVVAQDKSQQFVVAHIQRLSSVPVHYLLTLLHKPRKRLSAMRNWHVPANNCVQGCLPVEGYSVLPTPLYLRIPAPLANVGIQLRVVAGDHSTEAPASGHRFVDVQQLQYSGGPHSPIWVQSSFSLHL